MSEQGADIFIQPLVEEVLELAARVVDHAPFKVKHISEETFGKTVPSTQGSGLQAIKDAFARRETEDPINIDREVPTLVRPEEQGAQHLQAGA